MIPGIDDTGQQAVRAATEYIIKEAYNGDKNIPEVDRAIIELHVAGTLAWLVSRWRSEGEDIEATGKTFIAAALETTAHLEDLLRMDDEEEI